VARWFKGKSLFRYFLRKKIKNQGDKKRNVLHRKKNDKMPSKNNGVIFFFVFVF
jgi:hypothetical protein